MALLQPTVAIYHHPLDTTTESLKTDIWTGSGSGSLAAAKVANGMFPVAGGGTSSTFGSETEVLSASTTSISVISLSATTLVVSYQDASGVPTEVKSRVGIVSGSVETQSA